MTQTDAQNQGLWEEISDMHKIAADIRNIRCSAENLHRLGDRFPALSRNAARILASLKMIELSVPDAEPLPVSEKS